MLCRNNGQKDLNMKGFATRELPIMAAPMLFEKRQKLLGNTNIKKYYGIV